MFRSSILYLHYLLLDSLNSEGRLTSRLVKVCLVEAGL